MELQLLLYANLATHFLVITCFVSCNTWKNELKKMNRNSCFVQKEASCEELLSSKREHVSLTNVFWSDIK